MTHTQSRNFVKSDGSIDTERAMRAGYDARTATIAVFARSLGQLLKATMKLLAAGGPREASGSRP
jgi:hypothetical protein